MSWLFHVPTLATLGLAQLGVRRRPSAALWLLLAVVLGSVGLTAIVAASGREAFATLRGCSWLVFAYLPLHTVGGALALRRAAPRSARLLGAAGLLVPAVGLWAFFIEPLWLEVSHFTVRSPKLERPLRVAVLADLQTDRIGGHERRALAAVMDARPDLVLLPGDYLQVGDAATLRRETRKLQDALRQVSFSAPLGVYAVRGDVEADGWQSIFAGTGIRTFEQTTRVELPELVVTALSPRDARLRRAWPRRSERFHLAFGHAPEFALDQQLLDKPSADLMVAGHTHGGQVRLPFFGPPITFSNVPRSWAAGRTDFANQGVLIVSRGVGMERGPAPRLRFLCRPEVVVIDLVPGPPERRLAELSN